MSDLGAAADTGRRYWLEGSVASDPEADKAGASGYQTLTVETVVRTISSARHNRAIQIANVLSLKALYGTKRCAHELAT
jgi:hypothetical protein